MYSALVNLSKARDESAEHLELEKLLVTLSSKFINLPMEETDKAINQVIETIGEFAGVDRSYLLMIREDEPPIMDNTFEWCSPGTQSVMHKVQSIDLGHYTWWHTQMKSGKSLFIDDINELPKAAAAEKEIFLSESIKSIANIPLFINEKLAGSLGFDMVNKNVEWTEESHILLEVVGGIISNALDRQQYEINLSDSRARYQRRSEELNALRDTIADITSELEINKLLQTILERAIKLLGADGGDFCVFDEEEQILRVVALVNMNKRYLNTIVHLDEGAAGKAASERKTIILEDYSMWNEKMEDYDEASLRSAMVTPLIIGDRLLGTIGMFHFVPEKHFSEDDQHLLSMFAQHASIALDNAMLFDRIQELARIDELTGLLNRRSFIERTEYEINRARRLDHSLAIAMIDLDNFKEVNDQFSHQIGDQVLREIANLLCINIRNIDIIGRYGGDEITLLMPETTQDNAFQALQRLKNILAEHEFICNERVFRVTASIGLACYQAADASFEKMISAADEALYRAKDHGRNQVSL